MVENRYTQAHFLMKPQRELYTRHTPRWRHTESLNGNKNARIPGEYIIVCVDNRIHIRVFRRNKSNARKNWARPNLQWLLCRNGDISRLESGQYYMRREERERVRKIDFLRHAVWLLQPREEIFRVLFASRERPQETIRSYGAREEFSAQRSASVDIR